MYNAYLEIKSISENYTKSIITSRIKILNVEKFGYVILSGSLTSVRSTRLNDPSTEVYPAGAREDQKGSVWLISISRKDVFAKLAPFQEGEGDESRRGSGHFVIQRRRDGRSRRLKVSTAVRVIGSIAADNSDREFRPLAAFCAPFLLFLATKPEPEDWIVRFLRFCFSSFLSFFPFLPFFPRKYLSHPLSPIESERYQIGQLSTYFFNNRYYNCKQYPYNDFVIFNMYTRIDRSFREAIRAHISLRDQLP